MVVNRLPDPVISIIQDREKPSGLTHVYKEGSEWKFIPENEFEQRKGELPGLSLAIRYPFANFKEKQGELPDLIELQEKIRVSD